ncbi:hypothetical protein GE09DRAFT_1231138 [Coniochaeta sp. 2T2.1]|nr:hypothetical protein GE09DRAFT_1231138 [Coniochaeta sp. 2T2.1]
MEDQTAWYWASHPLIHCHNHHQTNNLDCSSSHVSSHSHSSSISSSHSNNLSSSRGSDHELQPEEEQRHHTAPAVCQCHDERHRRASLGHVDGCDGDAEEGKKICAWCTRYHGGTGREEA